MTEFMELQDFYKSVSGRISPTQNGVGHFDVFKIEDISIGRQKPIVYRRRNFFKASIVTGRCNIHYADRRFEIKNTALVFTNPLIPFHWEVIDENQAGFVVIFTEPFVSQQTELAALPIYKSSELGVIMVEEDQIEKFKTLFEKIFSEYQGSYAFKMDLIRNLLMEIVHEAQKLKPSIALPNTGSNAAERICNLFTSLLDRQFPIDSPEEILKLKSPSDYAHQLNIHVNHLNKALKEKTGQTTSQLIKERILQESRQLLKSTNWTINEIAWSLGFVEPNHFTRFFKASQNISPKEFRQTAID